MANYEEKRVKLTKIQLNELTSAAKSKAARSLRVTKKNFQDGELLAHELFLAIRQ